MCHLPSRPDGMPPEGTEWMAWRKNVEFRGHHLVLRGRTRGGGLRGEQLRERGNARGERVLVLRRAPASRRVREKSSRRRRRCGRERPGVRAGRDAGGGGGIVDLQTRCHAQEYDAPVWDGAEDMNDPGVRAKYNDRLLRAFSSAKRQRKVARIQAERRGGCAVAGGSGCDARQPRGGHRGRAGRARWRSSRARAGTSRRTTRTPPTRTTRTRCGVSRCTPSPIARGGKTCWRRRRSRRSSSLCARTATWTASCWTWCPDWIRLIRRGVAERSRQSVGVPGRAPGVPVAQGRGFGAAAEETRRRRRRRARRVARRRRRRETKLC